MIDSRTTAAVDTATMVAGEIALLDELLAELALARPSVGVGARVGVTVGWTEVGCEEILSNGSMVGMSDRLT